MELNTHSILLNVLVRGACKNRWDAAKNHSCSQKYGMHRDDCGLIFVGGEEMNDWTKWWCSIKIYARTKERLCQRVLMLLCYVIEWLEMKKKEKKKREQGNVCRALGSVNWEATASRSRFHQHRCAQIWAIISGKFERLWYTGKSDSINWSLKRKMAQSHYIDFWSSIGITGRLPDWQQHSMNVTMVEGPFSPICRPAPTCHSNRYLLQQFLKRVLNVHNPDVALLHTCRYLR